MRMVQEALANIRKHAAARHATVTVRSEERSLVLTVEDDGRGFDEATIPPGHYGLQIMRERAQSISATLSVQTHGGSGTRLRIDLETLPGIRN